MAERTLEIELLLKDKEALSRLKSAFDQMEKSGKKTAAGLSLAWTEFNSALSLIERGAAPIISFMHGAIEAALQQEDAINRLNIALKNQGTFTQGLSADFQKMASELQASTRFSDDAILGVQQRLVAIGNVAPAEMSKVTKAVLDFSTATGTDLVAASTLFAKAAAGNTSALSRYGLVLDEHIPKSERFSALLKLVQERMGGAAQGDINTYSGAVAKLGNAWGDFLEEAGNFVIKNPQVIQGLKLTEEAVIRLTNALKDSQGAAQDAFGALLNSGLPGAFASLGASAAEGTKGLDAALTGMQGIFSGLFAEGPTILEQMFGGEEAQAAVLETLTVTADAVKTQKQTFEEELSAIRAEFNEVEYQNLLIQEERKIEAQRQMLLAWNNEKTAAIMAQQQRESEFVQFALDTQKKAHESFWPTVGKLRDQFSSGLSKMFTDAITGTGSFSEAFKNMGKQMLATLIEYGVQLTVNAALAQALQASAVASTLPAAATTASAWAKAAAMVSIATFGAAAAAGAAGITATVALASTLAKIPGLETGGTILSPGRVLVGESGPEILNLPRGAQVRPLDAGSGQNIINISVVLNNPVISSRQIADDFALMIAERVSEFIETEARRLR